MNWGSSAANSSIAFGLVIATRNSWPASRRLSTAGGSAAVIDSRAERRSVTSPIHTRYTTPAHLITVNATTEAVSTAPSPITTSPMNTTKATSRPSTAIIAGAIP